MVGLWKRVEEKERKRGIWRVTKIFIRIVMLAIETRNFFREEKGH